MTRDRILDCLYRWTLLAYPESFRRRFGEEMLELFRSRHARARARGGRAQVSFWLEILGDLSRTASSLRLEMWRAPSIAPRRKESRMDTLVQDLKLSLRQVLHAPGFTSAALLIVGVGIGVNVTMFSIVDAVLFRPQTWEQPEKLVWIYQDSDEGEPSSCSYPAFRDIAARTDVFSGAAALIPGRPARYLTSDGQAQAISVSYVTSSLFPVLGLTPSRGRWFDANSDRPGDEPAGVVSHRAWRMHFGSDPGIVGSVVRINGTAVTIVGVGPEGYRGEVAGVDADLWLSIAAAGPVGGEYYWSTLERREDHWFIVIARVLPAVSATETQEAMNVLAARFATDYPDLDRGRKITVFSAENVRVHPEYDAFLFPAGGVLLAVAGLVLIVACSNLAHLLLARVSARSREIAIRLSMGATRGRLLRQLLTESTVLSLGGAGVGLFFAAVAGRALGVLRPLLDLPVNLEVALDSRLLVFAALLSLFTGLVFGIAPALKASRPALVPTLKGRDAGGTTDSPRRWLSLRNALVSVQVATSIVLLVGTGLLVRSLLNAQNVDPGFDVKGLAVLEADPAEAGYEADAGRRLFQELRDRIAALSGVERVALTTRLPVTPSGGASTLEIEGYDPPTGTGKAEVVFAMVDSEYFSTMRVPPRHGRVFLDTDVAATESVAVVNEAFARQYFGTTDATDRRYRHEGADSWVRIVGVVGDIKVRVPHEPSTPILFRPLSQVSGAFRLFLVARVSPNGGEPSALAGRMRAELRDLDENVPVYQAGTLADHVDASLGLSRAAAATLAAFGALALVLAATGLYAAINFAVSRRTLEIGIRMALGAGSPQVVGAVVQETVGVVAAGLGIGLGLSLLATPALESVLFGVGVSDPLTLGAVALFMMAVAAAAAYVPARRAVRLNPVEALRVG